MKDRTGAIVYLVVAAVLFGCMASEVGTRDYNTTGIITKVMMLVIIVLCGGMMFDAVKEFHKSRK